MPAVVAVRVMTTEWRGPLGLAMGLRMRVAAAGIRCALLVALISRHGLHGFCMHWMGI